MIDFIQFNTDDPEHIKLAVKGQDVIFEDHVGVFRIGWISEDYHGNGTSSYSFRCQDKAYQANYSYFALINRKKRDV